MHEGRFLDPLELPPRELVPGVTIRPMWGERIMMVLVELAPHARVPLHSHPHEQMGMVLHGEFHLEIDGVGQQVRQGQAYMVPSGVQHQVANGAAWALALDIFSPPREEYKLEPAN